MTVKTFSKSVKILHSYRKVYEESSYGMLRHSVYQD